MVDVVTLGIGTHVSYQVDFLESLCMAWVGGPRQLVPRVFIFLHTIGGARLSPRFT